MDDDFFDRDYDVQTARPRHDNLFLWTVLILLLIGVALAAWLGSYYVFGHPEKPRSYELLRKLHKVDPPERFELTEAPPGDFLTAQKVFDKYSTFTAFELAEENNKLLRSYIKNYRETKKLVPYVVGRFNIVDSFVLKESDVFPSGVVALAQSEDFPRVLIEHV